MVRRGMAPMQEQKDADGGAQAGRVDVSLSGGGEVVVRLSGAWRIGDAQPELDAVRAALATPRGGARLSIANGGLGRWDSALATYVLKLLALCEAAGAKADISGLPEGLRRLIALATAVPQREDARRAEPPRSLATAIGVRTLRWADTVRATMHFLGEVTIALARMATGRARYLSSDLLLHAQECGAQALPIVTVIAVLVGLIMAFVGAVQLRQFGADIYVANMVVIAMSREMAALMTAIVLAGRTGAAFAAQIGTMQGNEEVDALLTLGIPPVEFLVLPRVVALGLMTPLLCVYANLMGMLGGYVVAVGMLNVTSVGYVHQTLAAAHLHDFAVGIVKSLVFGLIVAAAGCLQGITCGRSAAAVGDATTAAVVNGILYIIVADGVFAVILHLLHI